MKCFPSPRSQRYTPTFSSTAFVVLPLISLLKTQLLSTFVMLGSVGIQLHCSAVSEAIFPAPSSKSVLLPLIFGSIFIICQHFLYARVYFELYSVPSFCLFPCQYHDTFQHSRLTMCFNAVAPPPSVALLSAFLVTRGQLLSKLIRRKNPEKENL